MKKILTAHKSKWITAGAAFILMTGCELSPQDQAAIDGVLEYKPVVPTPPPIGNVDPECFVQRSVQPPAIVTTKLDLLFVADTSGSLDQERAAIADGIDAFVNNLPAEVNTSIAVVMAHGPNSSFAGKLFSGATEPAVLNTKTMSMADVRAGLRNKLTKTKSDYYSDGGEAMMWATLRLLKSDRIGLAKQAGFFRDDAALVVINITDENDLCAIYPTGVERVPDLDGDLEKNFFKNHCAGVTPKAVYDSLKALKGDKPLVISGIVYNDQNYPRGGENEYAWGIMELISLSSNFSVNMATGRYDEGLGEIGNLASVSLRLVKDFILSQPADKIIESSIGVEVDGKAAHFEYKKDINTVHVPEPGSALSTIDVRFCIKPQQCTGPACDPIGV